MNPLPVVLLLMLLLCATPLAAQQIAVQEGPDRLPAARLEGPQAPTVEQIHERFRRFQALLSLSASERRSGLEQLVVGPDEDLAVLAARQLIIDESSGAEALIVPQIGGWSERNQLVVLEELRSRPGVDREIAREVLWQSISKPAELHYQDRPSLPVDLAAVLVARQPGPADGGLILQALQMNPNTRGLWLVAVKLEVIGPDQRRLALTTWRDESLSLMVRSAAAVAVIGTDPRAEAFVVDAIRSTLNPQAGGSGGDGGPDRLRVLRQVAMIGLLEFLPHQSAGPVLTDLLAEQHGALDPAIRAVALLHSPGFVALKDVPREMQEYVRQFQTGLFLGF